jgi:hypothetical protein
MDQEWELAGMETCPTVGYCAGDLAGMEACSTLDIVREIWQVWKPALRWLFSLGQSMDFIYSLPHKHNPAESGTQCRADFNIRRFL